MKATLVTKKFAPGGRGFGTVSMSNEKEAAKCIDKMDRMQLHGKQISVAYATSDCVTCSDIKCAVDSSVKSDGPEHSDHQSKKIVRCWSGNRVVAVYTARKDLKRLPAPVKSIRQEGRRDSKILRRQMKEEQFLIQERNRLERGRRLLEDEKLDIEIRIKEQLQQFKAASDPSKPSFWST